MRTILHKKKGATNIWFYADYKIDYIKFEHLLPEVMEFIFNSVIVKKLRKIEVYFIMNDKYQIGFKEGIEYAIQNTSIRGAGIAGVDPKDIKRRKNKIKIYIDYLYAISVKNYERYIKKVFLTIQLADYCNDYILKNLKNVLIHEITHLVHLRKQDSHKLYERNKARLAEATKNVAIQSGKSPYMLGVFWKTARVLLEKTQWLICVEGFASFNALYETGEVDFSEKSFKEHYDDAIRNAKKANINFLQFYKVLKRNDFQKNNIAIAELQMSLPRHFYNMGEHVYQCILYFNEDLSIADLITYNYRKILKQYEKTCKHEKIRPVYTIFGNQGYFNYSYHQLILRKIRKDPSLFKS